MTLSGARDFQFEAVSDLTAKLSFLLKQATINNTRVRELEHLATAKLINDERNFEPTIQGELDELLEILDESDIELKKSMFPYELRQLQAADEIETSSQLVDADFINLQTEFDKVNDVTTEQKQQKRLEDTVEVVIDEKNPFTNLDKNFWWEDDFFDKRDSNETVEVSKNILNNALQLSQKNIRPVDDGTTEQLIDDDFISIDYRT